MPFSSASFFARGEAYTRSLLVKAATFGTTGAGAATGAGAGAGAGLGTATGAGAAVGSGDDFSSTAGALAKSPEMSSPA